MSVNQIRQCIAEILGHDSNNDSLDWNSHKLKKLSATTSTLYNVSLNKVMLKQTEEIARYHICAYLAVEKYSEKYEPELQFDQLKIPLEPRKIIKILGVFKQLLCQTSSPNSEIQCAKDSKRSISLAIGSSDCSELRDQSIVTPKVKRKGPSLLLDGDVDPSLDMESFLSKISRPRRKLVFEENEEAYDFKTPDLEYQSPRKSPRRSLFRNGIEPDPEEIYTSSPTKSFTKLDFKSVSNSANSPRKKRGEYNKWNMLDKKYYRMNCEEIISLCNQFEIPAKVAYLILDCFGIHATYFVCPARLVCGLIMLCCFTIYNRKRANDPTIDDYLLQKMRALMRSNDTNDVIEAIQITRELLDGEKWYRNLKVEYDYYEGTDFENNIAVRLGNMLQNTNMIVSEEQFHEWKKKVMMDISLRDGS